jgi:hypothetical protein
MLNTNVSSSCEIIYFPTSSNKILRKVYIISKIYTMLSRPFSQQYGAPSVSNEEDAPNYES